jgi:hypothetical protein
MTPLTGFDLEPDQRRRYGRLGAVLFAAGALGTLPAAFLLEPVPGAEILLVTALGGVSAIVCWFLPWTRLPGWTFDALAVAGTLEILLVCHVVDETYRVLYFVVVVFAALALPTRQRVAAQFGVVVLALAEPITHETGGQEHARILLLYTPALVTVTIAVRYLRETLEQRERSSRAFAREAIQLAIRLRRGTAGRELERNADLEELERAVEELR